MTRPDCLEGHWEEQDVDEHGYRHFRAGPVDVRGFDGPDGFEPDGELVTTKPVRVHMERMTDGEWWIGLSWGKTGRVAVNFWSSRAISVRWSDDRG